MKKALLMLALALCALSSYAAGFDVSYNLVL
jgi:hypothetical protein